MVAPPPADPTNPGYVTILPAIPQEEAFAGTTLQTGTSAPENEADTTTTPQSLPLGAIETPDVLADDPIRRQIIGNCLITIILSIFGEMHRNPQ